MVQLSQREEKILRLLSQGETYAQIKQRLGMSSANLHVQCYNIRQKTGIKETRDPIECRNYFRNRGAAPTQMPASLKPPTPQQSQVLHLIAQGKPYGEIAQTLNIKDSQTVQNIACQGAKRLGIKNAGWQRNRLIRERLASPATDPMNDPMF